MPGGNIKIPGTFVLWISLISFTAEARDAAGSTDYSNILKVEIPAKQ